MPACLGESAQRCSRWEGGRHHRVDCNQGEPWSKVTAIQLLEMRDIRSLSVAVAARRAVVVITLLSLLVENGDCWLIQTWTPVDNTSSWWDIGVFLSEPQVAFPTFARFDVWIDVGRPATGVHAAAGPCNWFRSALLLRTPNYCAR